MPVDELFQYTPPTKQLLPTIMDDDIFISDEIDIYLAMRDFEDIVTEDDYADFIRRSSRLRDARHAAVMYLNVTADTRKQCHAVASEKYRYCALPLGFAIFMIALCRCRSAVDTGLPCHLRQCILVALVSARLSNGVIPWNVSHVWFRA